MSIGRGFPLWRPAPATVPQAHLEQGFSIGDVGCLDRRGGFQYLFNIFYPRDHAVQDIVPRNFKPINPHLSDWKIQVSAGDISPGSIITSHGITSTRVSEQPLCVSCSYLQNSTRIHFLTVKSNLPQMPEKEACSFFQRVLLVKTSANLRTSIPT